MSLSSSAPWTSDLESGKLSLEHPDLTAPTTKKLLNQQPIGGTIIQETVIVREREPDIASSDLQETYDRMAEENKRKQKYADDVSRVMIEPKCAPGGVEVSSTASTESSEGIRPTVAATEPILGPTTTQPESVYSNLTAAQSFEHVHLKKDDSNKVSSTAQTNTNNYHYAVPLTQQREELLRPHRYETTTMTEQQPTIIAPAAVLPPGPFYDYSTAPTTTDVVRERDVTDQTVPIKKKDDLPPRYEKPLAEVEKPFMTHLKEKGQEFIHEVKREVAEFKGEVQDQKEIWKGDVNRTDVGSQHVVIQPSEVKDYSRSTTKPLE
jgi:hypothetical protein